MGMRPRVRFRHMVGFFFVLYALAYAARPDVGVIGYAAALYGVPSSWLIALFGVCGVLMLVLPVHPPMVALLSLPISLIAFAYIVRAINEPDSISWTGAIAQVFTLSLILRWAWRRAKEGTDD